jgi:hypothetical protein
VGWTANTRQVPTVSFRLRSDTTGADAMQRMHISTCGSSGLHAGSVSATRLPIRPSLPGVEHDIRARRSGSQRYGVTLKYPMAVTLPFAPEPLLNAINRGVPPVVEQPNRPIGVALEDCAFFVSKEDQRKQRPSQPTDAWRRVAWRAQQRRQQAS